MHVIVIGAGVQGIATAWYLHQYGCEVTVVERHSHAGMESSYGNGGALTTSAPEPWNAPGIHKVLLQSLGRTDAPVLLRLKAVPGMMSWGLGFLKASKQDVYLRNIRRNSALSAYSLRLLKEIREQSGIEFRHSGAGMLFVFRDQPSLDAYIEHAGFLRAECGITNKALERNEMISLEPSLEAIKEQLPGAIYFPQDETGDCHQFCRNLAAHLAGRGVRFLYRTTVEKITNGKRTISLNLMAGERLTGDAVVVCAGAYTPKLVRSLGIRVPVYPAKGYSLTLPMDGWENRPRRLIADMGLHAGVNPLGGEVLRVAGTAEFTGYDTSIPKERVQNLLGLVEAIFPEFAATMDRDNINPWAGFRPMSNDGVPVIGRTKIEGLYLNTGQGHLGWTMAAASGRVAADIILDRVPEVDADHYSPDRF